MTRFITAWVVWATFFILSLILSAAECQVSINKIANNFNDTDATSLEQVTCMDIKAELSTCHDCYLCDSYEYKERKKENQEVTYLEMVDGSCSTTQFCCLSQVDYVTRQNDNCGKINPEGSPRSIRERLRSVLQGEYPWRAWVYRSSDTSKPLCSATYISENYRALITAASCIKEHVNEKLFLKFTRSGQFIEVHRKFIHEGFRADGRHNDIALISWRSLEAAPVWISPCCIEANLPPFGLWCVGVSSDDNYMTQTIPKQKRCKPQLTSPNVMCAMAPGYEYTPEKGSTLMCESQGSYVAYGIALHTENGITVYTNVTQYNNWIESKFDLLG